MTGQFSFFFFLFFFSFLSLPFPSPGRRPPHSVMVPLVALVFIDHLLDCIFIGRRNKVFQLGNVFKELINIIRIVASYKLGDSGCVGGGGCVSHCGCGLHTMDNHWLSVALHLSKNSVAGNNVFLGRDKGATNEHRDKREILHSRIEKNDFFSFSLISTCSLYIVDTRTYPLLVLLTCLHIH
ncbi:hypothetical protein BDF14DRAFT_1833261 [Spinellus fusiger]|nr:hypothetical protein BDF14DRAFT_1833261 [Spinellus fusiger]